MDVFGNFLIGLREGLEAALVVGILVAYLVRTDNRDRLQAIWLGVGVAVTLSLAVGAALTFIDHELDVFKAQETFGGVMSIIAVAFVTWMVFWMRRQARALRGELQDKLAAAVAGGTIAVAVMAFIAVGREGLETALFLWPAIRAAGSGAEPMTGAFLGIVVACVIGWLLYRGSVKLNLATFFTITGAALIVVAAGVLAYGVHDLQEAGVLPGLDNLAFDVSAQVPPSSWYGTLLKGIFNFSAASTWLEVVVYFGYLVPTMILFFRPARRPAVAPTPTPQEVPAR